MSERPSEMCSACGCATGHAGYGEDSIGYVDGTIGPLCDGCNQRLRAEIEQSRNADAERVTLLQAIHGAYELLSIVRDDLNEAARAAGGGE